MIDSILGWLGLFLMVTQFILIVYNTILVNSAYKGIKTDNINISYRKKINFLKSNMHVASDIEKEKINKIILIDKINITVVGVLFFIFLIWALVTKN